MISASAFNLKGEKLTAVKLPKEAFGVEVKPTLLAQAVRVWLSNQRKSSAKTKTRTEVAGSTRKLFKQKGTGRARHGSIRAPIFVGGGISHGPSGEQNYKMSLPAKMRRLALIGALSVKATAKSIKIVDGAGKANGKTKQLEWLDEGMKTLVVAGSGQDKFKQGIRNLQGMSIAQAESLSAYAVLANKQLVITVEALEEIKKRYAN